MQEMISQKVRTLSPEIDPLRMGMGQTEADLEKPQVMVESTFGDSHPGSAHLLCLVEAAAAGVRSAGGNCALPGFVDSKNEEKTERNAGYLVVSHSGGGMLRQGTRKGIRRTPANRGMRAHWVVKGLDISEDVCHGMCP